MLNQELFDYLHDTFGIIPLGSQMNEINRIVEKSRTNDIEIEYQIHYRLVDKSNPMKPYRDKYRIYSKYKTLRGLIDAFSQTNSVYKAQRKNHPKSYIQIRPSAFLKVKDNA